MRLSQQLEINGQELRLISDSLVRQLFSPGVALLVVESDTPPEPGQLVRYSLGWTPGSVWIWFLGYVCDVIQIDARQYRLVVRELTASLTPRLPLTLRHCRISDVLERITAETGLNFTLGPGRWNQTRIPFFYHTGTGCHALSLLGDLFQIRNYVWQQQSDGRVYVGEWSGLPNADAVVPIPVRGLTQYTSGNRATVPSLPRFRPGLRIQVGNAEPAIITRIEQSGATMRLAWSVNPWGTLRRTDSDDRRRSAEPESPAT